MLGRTIDFSLITHKDSLHLSKKIILVKDKIVFEKNGEIDPKISL